MCYFLYRFDSRLVSLERRLWDKEHGSVLIESGKPNFYKQLDRKGEAVSTKWKTGGNPGHLKEEPQRILSKKGHET